MSNNDSTGETDVSRRNFLKSATVAAAASAALTTGYAGIAGANTGSRPVSAKRRSTDKPNILIITCDQVAWDAIAANGNNDVETPAIDQIVRNGTSFDKTYCSYPLCSPSRASFWTSQLPHKTRVTGNESQMVPEKMTRLGKLFTDAGYETKHFGKTHDFGALDGFDISRQKEYEVEDSPAYPASYQTKIDQHTLEVSLDYLQQPHDEPFLMVTEFYNPHNINNWIGAYRGPHGDIPGMGVLPPLRPNYQNDDLENRPNAVKYLCCTNKRQADAAQWSDKNFQQYLNAYYHYTQLGDSCVGSLIKGLANSDAAENTLIIFLSDHGDGMGSHKLVAKSHYFYDEATKVPFVLSGPGIKAGARIDSLVSLCDLMPTICDYAGLDIPENLYGRSLMPLIRDEREPEDWRKVVVSQWYTARGFTIQSARMLRSKRYKYTHYLEDGAEELYDMELDPGETRNLAKDASYSEQLAEMRKKFDQYLAENDDPYFSLEAKVDQQWRTSHELGYHHHEGRGAMPPAG